MLLMFFFPLRLYKKSNDKIIDILHIVIISLQLIHLVVCSPYLILWFKKKKGNVACKLIPQIIQII